MITDKEQLHQAVECLEDMYTALGSLKREVLPLNPQQFALMAEGPLDQIRQLQEQIDAYTGESLAAELTADVWLKLEGRNIKWPETPTSVLTAVLDSLRKGVQLVAEFLATGQLTTRPTDDLKQACDLRVVAFQPGSLQVGLILPVPEDPPLPIDEEPSVAERALAEFLEVAAWAAADTDLAELDRKIVNPVERRVVLNAVKPLAPRPRGSVQSIQISGRFRPAGTPVRLTRRVHTRIDSAIDHLVSTQVETHEGDLREIDLDNHSFILRNAGQGELRCSFDDDILEAAKEALDSRVQVTGSRPVDEIRRRYAPLRVSRLEIVDEVEPQDVLRDST